MNIAREEHRKGKFLLAILYFLLKKNGNFVLNQRKSREILHTQKFRGSLYLDLLIADLR